MAIYFVRHGQDEEGYRGGWSQKGLIPEGIDQSEKLGEYLAYTLSSKIKRVLSSDLNRAQETADIIGRKLNLSVTPLMNLREINNGELAGIPNQQAERKYPGLYFNTLRMYEKYPGGESPRENYIRIKETFEAICEEHMKRNDDEDLLIVTHGGVINIIYHLVKGVEWSNKNQFYPAANTSLHKLDYLNGQWEFILENVTKHLDIHI